MDKPNALKQRQLDRLRWLEAGAASEHTALTEHQKAAVVRLIEEGATLVEVAALSGMPSVSTIYRESFQNEPFAQAMRSARAAAATTFIEEAQDNLRIAASSKDTDAMVIASAYHRGSLEYAAKIAPKEFGQLVKIAGADGGALTIQTINYSATIGNDGESSAPLARATPLQVQAAQTEESPDAA